MDKYTRDECLSKEISMEVIEEYWYSHFDERFVRWCIDDWWWRRFVQVQWGRERFHRSIMFQLGQWTDRKTCGVSLYVQMKRSKCSACRCYSAWSHLMNFFFSSSLSSSSFLLFFSSSSLFQSNVSVLSSCVSMMKERRGGERKRASE